MPYVDFLNVDATSLEPWLTKPTCLDESFLAPFSDAALASWTMHTRPDSLILRRKLDWRRVKRNRRCPAERDLRDYARRRNLAFVGWEQAGRPGSKSYAGGVMNVSRRRSKHAGRSNHVRNSLQVASDATQSSVMMPRPSADNCTARISNAEAQMCPARVYVYELPPPCGEWHPHGKTLESVFGEVVPSAHLRCARRTNAWATGQIYQ